MKILIIEDDIYLSQKVSSKLIDAGFICESCVSIGDIHDSYDVILLSTSIKNIDYVNFTKKNSNTIIILLAPYLSNETVTSIINHGASDYLVKPFLMDELIRKITHHYEFMILKKENKDLIKDCEALKQKISSMTVKYNFPIVINCLDSEETKKYAIKISNDIDKKLLFVNIEDNINFKYDDEIHSDQLICLVGVHNLCEDKKNILYDSIKNKDVIICQKNFDEPVGFMCIKIKEEQKKYTVDTILSLSDYIKYIVLSFQDEISDTKLSQKLGISRKSLWEKRKKLSIEKIKK